MTYMNRRDRKTGLVPVVGKGAGREDPSLKFRG